MTSKAVVYENFDDPSILKTVGRRTIFHDGYARYAMVGGESWALKRVDGHFVLDYKARLTPAELKAKAQGNPSKRSVRKRVAAALKKFVRGNPSRKGDKSVRLKNFTGTVVRHRNGVVSVHGVQTKGHGHNPGKLGTQSSDRRAQRIHFSSPFATKREAQRRMPELKQMYPFVRGLRVEKDESGSGYVITRLR